MYAFNFQVTPAGITNASVHVQKQMIILLQDTL